MLRPRLIALLLVFCCLPLSGVCAADSFHFEASLSDGTSSLRRAELPWPVLSHLMQAGRADLQVYNADNQMVPSQVREVDALHALTWQSVPLQAGEQPQQFRYDIPPAVPVSLWRMHLPQPGSAYEGILYTRLPTPARYGEKQPEWRQQASFRHYWLQTKQGEVRSDPSPFPAWESRQWRLEFTRPSPLPPDAAPWLELGWKLLEVRFIAQGTGPFRLRYGSLADSIQPAAFDDRLNMSAAESVTVGEEVQLAPLPRLQTTDHKRFSGLFWVILAAAVLLLLWMAKRLLGEMGKPQG